MSSTGFSSLPLLYGGIFLCPSPKVQSEFSYSGSPRPAELLQLSGSSLLFSLRRVSYCIFLLLPGGYCLRISAMPRSDSTPVIFTVRIVSRSISKFSISTPMSSSELTRVSGTVISTGIACSRRWVRSSSLR
jgi:hypothetical protein